MDFIKNNQEKFIDETFLHPVNIKQPINKKYQLNSIKYLIEKLSETEMDERFYDILMKLFKNQREDKWIYKHYKLKNNFIKIKQSGNLISNGTTGLCTWHASLALSEFILNKKNHFKNKKILELGSGIGLLGFVTANFCQPEKIVLSDCHPEVLSLLEENLRVNFENSIENEISENKVQCSIQLNSGTNIKILDLPWEEVEKSGVENIVIPEVILGADLVYDDSIFDPLSSTIDYLFKIAEHKCTMFLSVTVRNEATLEKFLRILGKTSLDVIKFIFYFFFFFHFREFKTFLY